MKIVWLAISVIWACLIFPGIGIVIVPLAFILALQFEKPHHNRRKAQ